MSLLKMTPLSQRLVASNQLAGPSCRSMATVVDKIKEKAGVLPDGSLAIPLHARSNECLRCGPVLPCVCSTGTLRRRELLGACLIVC